MTTLDNEKMIKELREWEKNIKKRISNKIYDITPLKVAARMGNNEEEMRKSLAEWQHRLFLQQSD